MSLNKKVTKEVSIGEALSAGRSRTRAALPYVPLPARTWHLRSTLTTENLRFPGLSVARAPLSLPCRFLSVLTQHGKNRNIFAMLRMKVKVLRGVVSARREILKRASLLAGASNSAPLKSASLGTFLAETRKVHTFCLNDKLKFAPQIRIGWAQWCNEYCRPDRHKMPPGHKKTAPGIPRTVLLRALLNSFI